MAGSFDYQAELEALGRSLEGEGFGFRPAQYFAENGILAFVRPVERSSISVIEKSVFLYATSEGWHARVTQHGGHHWTRVVASAPELREAALEALRAPQLPPTETWSVS